MTNNLSIPENLQPVASLLKQYLQPLLLWFSQYVYQRLLARAQDDRLVQLEALLDFTKLEEACADYHHQTGPGRRPTHTVPKMLRALFIKYLYDYSLRELEQQVRLNLLVKWFVGYPVFAEGPDHTTLHRFELWLYLYQPRLFFDTILTQIDAAFPHERERPQIADTFALHADAALESLIDRLRHSCQQMLVAFKAAHPVAYDALWSRLDEAALFGSQQEPAAYHLSNHQWRARLLRTVTALLDCLALVQAHEEVDAPVQAWVDRLQKILADEVALTRDEAGHLTAVSLLPPAERGQYRICSATDPDATIRNHGPGKEDFGYNVSLATTTNFIREIRADTGSTPDTTPIPDLITAQQAHHDCVPPKLIYDQIAGSGKTAAAVDKATDGQTQLVAKPMPYDQRHERFGPRDFTLSDDELTLTCPHGRTSVRKYRSGSGDGFIFRFMPAQCRGCPFLAACRGKPAPPTTKRDVFISDYRLAAARLQAYSQTEAFKADMKLRPQVERVIAALVQHNGARRARFRGLQKVDFQVKMQAMAYNVKRWLVLLKGKRPQKRRRFGAPLPTRGGVRLAAG